MKEKLWIGRNYKVKKKKVEEEQLISWITGGALVWDMQVSMGSERCLGTEVPKPLFSLRPSWLILLGLSCVHIYVIHLRSPWATLPDPLTGPDPPGSHCCPKSPTAAPVSVWAVVHPFWQVLSFCIPGTWFSSWHKVSMWPGASPVAQQVRNLSAMQETQETWVWSLGEENPLQKEMETHSSISARKIPWTEEPGGLQSKALPRVRQDWATTHTHTSMWPMFINCLIEQDAEYQLYKKLKVER